LRDDILVHFIRFYCFVLKSSSTDMYKGTEVPQILPTAHCILFSLGQNFANVGSAVHKSSVRSLTLRFALEHQTGKFGAFNGTRGKISAKPSVLSHILRNHKQDGADNTEPITTNRSTIYKRGAGVLHQAPCTTSSMVPHNDRPDHRPLTGCRKSVRSSSYSSSTPRPRARFAR